MMDFLEHQPDEATAAMLLEKFARTARGWLFIRHPSFEPADVEYMESLGVKFGWTDWTGHWNMMTVADFERVFASFGWRDYAILPHMAFFDSSHESIVPLSAPTDTERHDEAAFGPKPAVEFARPIFGRFDIFVRLDARMSEQEWHSIATVARWATRFE